MRVAPPRYQHLLAIVMTIRIIRFTANLSNGGGRHGLRIVHMDHLDRNAFYYWDVAFFRNAYIET